MHLGFCPIKFKLWFEALLAVYLLIFSSSHLPIDSNDERRDEVSHFSANVDQLKIKREEEIISFYYTAKLLKKNTLWVQISENVTDIYSPQHFSVDTKTQRGDIILND